MLPLYVFRPSQRKRVRSSSKREAKREKPTVVANLQRVLVPRECTGLPPPGSLRAVDLKMNLQTLSYTLDIPNSFVSRGFVGFQRSYKEHLPHPFFNII